MIDYLEKCISDIEEYGISKNDVKKLEDKVGEHLISSIYNINGLTTERSSIGSEEIIDILNNYILDTKAEMSATPETEISDIVMLHGKMISYLESVLYYVNNIRENYSEEIKDKKLMSPMFYSYDSTTKEGFNVFFNNRKFDQFFWYIQDKFPDIESLNSDSNDDAMRALWTYDSNVANDRLVMIYLFVWRDNNLNEFILEGKPLINVNPTCQDFFDSLDGIHMITEGLENTIKGLKWKQKSLIENTCFKNTETNLYNVWINLLKNREIVSWALYCLQQVIRKSNVEISTGE